MLTDVIDILTARDTTPANRKLIKIRVTATITLSRNLHPGQEIPSKLSKLTQVSRQAARE